MKLISSIKKKLYKRRLMNRNMRKIDEITKIIVRTNELQSLSLNSNISLVEDENKNSKSIVASLTTYSKRIHDVHLVIESIGQQTIKPNRIILWLDIDEFSDENIPKILKNQKERGLEIRYYENIKAYKKLIPSLELCPESDIITFDDDILYPHDTIEILFNNHLKQPDSVVGIRSHTIRLDENNNPIEYKKWHKESPYSFNGDLTFLTTGAGTYFPAGILPSEIKNKKIFMEICPFSDDVWVNLVCIHSNVNRFKVDDDRKFSTRFLVIPENQDIALHKNNVDLARNDTQISKVSQNLNINYSQTN